MIKRIQRKNLWNYWGYIQPRISSFQTHTRTTIDNLFNLLIETPQIFQDAPEILFIGEVQGVVIAMKHPLGIGIRIF